MAARELVVNQQDENCEQNYGGSRIRAKFPCALIFVIYGLPLEQEFI